MRTLKPVYPFENVFPAMLKGIVPPMFWDENLPPTIRIDVEEAEKSYLVKADIPGVKKEDISVEVDGDQVSVTAEVKRETEEKKDEKVVHSERYYGKQFRSFTLGRPIDRDKVEAKFSEGVLELTLPKNGTTPASRIAIK